MTIASFHTLLFFTIFLSPIFFFFFFNDTATTEIYTLSLHDALPISPVLDRLSQIAVPVLAVFGADDRMIPKDRKSTRLNSSHLVISYAVFCLKKKKQKRYSLHCKKTYIYTNDRYTYK